jgi:hypothetical protein
MQRRESVSRIFLSSNSRVIHFDFGDFLAEALEEFLESGARPTKIASSIIKIATAAELMLKRNLEAICPALVLDAVDEMQVAKIFGLRNKLLAPKALDAVVVRTNAFPKLLARSGKFFDLSKFEKPLIRLHDIRNSLVHHHGSVDVAAVNLLLIKEIFPFFEQFTRNDKSMHFRLKPEMWARLKQLEESSWNLLITDLSKKLAHHADKARRLSSKRAALLLKESPESGLNEEIVDQGLLCPACKNASLAAFSEVDVDFDESGPVGGHFFFTMRCGVCGLELGDEEIHQVIAQFDKFFETGEAELHRWEEAIEEPDFSDFYP